MATVTCHTDGCTNADTPIDLTLTYEDEEGETAYVSGVVCGVCSQQITDIQPPIPGTDPEPEQQGGS